MLRMLWPILIVVASNTFYNICQKSTPQGINSFAALTLTYFVSGIISLILYYCTAENKNLLAELQHTNWASIVLGIALVALEFGYIWVYRVGWKVNIASLVANILLAMALLAVGTFLYHETIKTTQMIGIIVCVAGLILMTY